MTLGLDVIQSQVVQYSWPAQICFAWIFTVMARQPCELMSHSRTTLGKRAR